MAPFGLTKKRVLVSLTGLAVLAMIGTAIAYFTATGTGTGTATVGSSSTVSLAGTITGTLYPAGSPASVSVLVTNNGSGSQFVNTVHLASITPDAGHSSCSTTVATSGTSSDFTMADIPVSTTLAAGGTKTVTGSLQMNDTGVSQNACQGATLTLNFTSN